jgi:uncharacterized protein
MASSLPPIQDSLGDIIARLRRINGDAPATQARALPPVHLWNPPHCGDIGMEIRRDGSWWHEGTRITRQPLVELFATVLRKDEDGQTYLVTPGEKVIVHVQDAHFLGVRADRAGNGHEQTLVITTNCGDMVALGPECRLRIVTDPATGEPRPYVPVRGRLEARVLRAPFYELVEWGEEVDGHLGVWSRGVFMPLGRVS